MFATYVHDLNPVLLRITDAIQLRWYGLAYLMGFVCGFLLLRNLARRGLWVLKPEQTGDFIAAVALFGVFLGGRLGYILFYQIPKAGWSGLAEDPLMVFRVWEGGMASHGGILGMVIFTWFYARKHKVSWTGLGDGLCVVAPVGLFFGRVANFINGELYGRIAEGVPWAVKFPLSLAECPNEVQSAAWQACTEVDPRLAQATTLEPWWPRRGKTRRWPRRSGISSRRGIPRRSMRRCSRARCCSRSCGGCGRGFRKLRTACSPVCFSRFTRCSGSSASSSASRMPRWSGR